MASHIFDTSFQNSHLGQVMEQTLYPENSGTQMRLELVKCLATLQSSILQAQGYSDEQVILYETG